jgi:gluconolactonase
VEGKELAFQGVYRLDPDGRLRLLVRDMVRPNGIGLSPDGRTLYVTDSDRAEFRAFAMRDDGTVDQGRVLATLRPWKPGVQGVPDGLVVTAQGHVLVTGPGGVWVFDTGGACGVHVWGSGREDALHHRAVARVSDANDRGRPVSD